MSELTTLRRSKRLAAANFTQEFQLQPVQVIHSDNEVANPLGVSVILRQVMTFLPVPELLNCSLVNKYWNCEARRVLRDLKKCTARTGYGRACATLRRLDTSMARMNIVPFTGLSLDINDHTSKNCPTKRIRYKFIENHWKGLRYLKINWEWPNRAINCPSVQLIMRLLQSYGNNLEEIIFENVPPEAKFYQRGDLSQVSLPRLKALRLVEKMSQKLLETNLFQDLCSCAPNLEELDLELYTQQIAGFPKNKLGLIKVFRFLDIDLLANRNLEFALCNPKLRKLTVMGIPPREINIDMSREAVGRLLTSSSLTLQHLMIDSTMAAMMMSMKTPPLVDVNDLVIVMEAGVQEDLESLAALSRLNFTQLFPKVSDVAVVIDTIGERPRDGFVQVEAIEPKDGGDSSKIQSIVALGCFTPEVVPVLTRVFPYITRVRTRASDSEFYHNLWASWPKLNEITITQKVRRPDFNLDAAFCGIHPEEAAELQKMEPEFLEKVQIVPIRYAVTNMTSLAKLFIDLDPLHFGMVKPSHLFFLSKVTVFVAFKRMPTMLVTIMGGHKCVRALQHLESFTRVNPL